MLIVEPHVEGHWLSYVGMLVQQLSAGDSVLLALGEGARASREFTAHVDEVGAAAEVHTIESDSWARPAIQELASRFNADLTVMPSADEHLLGLALGGWHGGGRISGVVMRLRPQRLRPRPVLRCLMKLIALALCAARGQIDIFVLTSSISPVRPGLIPSIWDPITFSPDAEARLELVNRWQLDPSVQYFGIFGAITSRKNLPLVIDAVVDAGPDIGLIASGRIAPDVMKDLSAIRDRFNIIVDDSFLSEPELDSAMTLVSGVVLAHSNEGPSGLLGKAAAAGTLIVAAGARSLKRDVKRLKGQAIWVPLDRHHLSVGIRRATTLKRPSPTLMPTEAQFARMLLGLSTR